MSEELVLHRRAMLNIYFLIMCQLLGQMTLLVNVIYCGEAYEVSFKAITNTQSYPGGETVTYAMEIPKFQERYCEGKEGRPIQDICTIVPNLALAEYIYKLLLYFNFMIVIYNILNIWFTAYSERVPKFFSFNHMHMFYPVTYIIGSFAYFIVSDIFALKSGFTFALGFYLMVAIFVLAIISAIYYKTKVRGYKLALEGKEPLLSS